MKLLITGIAGFIGSNIAKMAILEGHEVIGVDDLSQGKIENVPKEALFLKMDLADVKDTSQLPKHIDMILHLAGQSSGEISFDDPTADLEKNTTSTLNLIHYGIAVKAKRIIYASSMSVYGKTIDKPIEETETCHPLSCYGVSKLAAEHYLDIYSEQLPYIALRMFNVYGPGQDMNNLKQGMVSIYLEHILKKGHVSVKGALSRFRDFIYIDDVVKVWLESVNQPTNISGVFNLATGKKTSVLELLLTFKKILPDISWEEIENTPGDQFGIYADVSKLKKQFNVCDFIPLSEGLERFYHSIK